MWNLYIYIFNFLLLMEQPYIWILDSYVCGYEYFKHRFASFLLVAAFLLLSWRCRPHDPLIRHLTFARLLGVTSQSGWSPHISYIRFLSLILSQLWRLILQIKCPCNRKRYEPWISVSSLSINGSLEVELLREWGWVLCLLTWHLLVLDFDVDRKK
jgi:hypothetical protein